MTDGSQDDNIFAPNFDIGSWFTSDVLPHLTVMFLTGIGLAVYGYWELQNSIGEIRADIAKMRNDDCCDLAHQNQRRLDRINAPDPTDVRYPFDTDRDVYRPFFFDSVTVPQIWSDRLMGRGNSDPDERGRRDTSAPAKGVNPDRTSSKKYKKPQSG